MVEAEEQKEIKDIIHYLDDFPSLSLRENNKESFVFKESESINNYASLFTIKLKTKT